MSNNKASEEELSKLHKALAEVLTELIKSGEASAAELSVARQFLRDNNIDCIPKKGNPLGSLMEALPFPDEDGVEGEKVNLN